MGFAFDVTPTAKFCTCTEMQRAFSNLKFSKHLLGTGLNKHQSDVNLQRRRLPHSHPCPSLVGSQLLQTASVSESQTHLLPLLHCFLVDCSKIKWGTNQHTRTLVPTPMNMNTILVWEHHTFAPLTEPARESCPSRRSHCCRQRTSRTGHRVQTSRSCGRRHTPND